MPKKNGGTSDKEWLSDQMLRTWLEAIIRLGNELIEASNHLAPRKHTTVKETFFAVAVDLALQWQTKLVELNKEKYENITGDLAKAVPQSKDIRNMHIHQVEYLFGAGRKQKSFVVDVGEKPGNIVCDASSAIVTNEGYLIGGRLNVQHAMRAAYDILKKLHNPHLG